MQDDRWIRGFFICQASTKEKLPNIPGYEEMVKYDKRFKKFVYTGCNEAVENEDKPIEKRVIIDNIIRQVLDKSKTYIYFLF